MLKAAESIPKQLSIPSNHPLTEKTHCQPENTCWTFLSRNILIKILPFNHFSFSPFSLRFPLFLPQAGQLQSTRLALLPGDVWGPRSTHKVKAATRGQLFGHQWAGHVFNTSQGMTWRHDINQSVPIGHNGHC